MRSPGASVKSSPGSPKTVSFREDSETSVKVSLQGNMASTEVDDRDRGSASSKDDMIEYGVDFFTYAL